MAQAAADGRPGKEASADAGGGAAAAAAALERAARLIATARRPVVLVGAGISTSAALPDFRTPGTGLYAQLPAAFAGLGLPPGVAARPEAAFSLSCFRADPRPFFALAKLLWPCPAKRAPTATHHFLALLCAQRPGARVFSQNIDALDTLAGLPAGQLVHAHGSFADAHCIDCGARACAYGVQAAVFADEVPACSSCGGLVKPAVTMFGERLPAAFHRARLQALPAADAVLVVGTSLAVEPFRSMLGEVAPGVPRVLINLERVGDIGSRDGDVVHLGACDDAVRRLAALLGCQWEQELARRVAAGEAAQREAQASCGDDDAAL